MNNEILNQFFNIQSSTIHDVKVLLQELKEQKNNELTKKILELESELKKIQKSKRYGIVFEEKIEEFEEKAKNALPLLKEEKDLEIKELNSNKPTNIIIEWDNFHSLSCLKYTHQNKIDVIYIDPPYNTGNKDFIYNDTFVDKEDSYRHSKWLSFMKKRLILAKDLLSEKWVIFISIDDNEQAQLKMLCDEIFWEENSLNSIIWHKKTQPSFLTKEIINVTEYILVYKKNNNEIIPFKWWLTDPDKLVEMLNKPNPICERKFKKENVIIWKNFNWLLEPWLYWNGDLKVNLLENIEIINWKPNKDIYIEWRFKWSQEKIDNALEDWASVYFKSTNTLRATLKINNNEAKIKPPINLFSKYINDAPTNTDATNELKNLFEWITPLDYPKPTKLIKIILESIVYDRKKATILDFFAWSGTTGHAVLELNKDDWWNRQFILCSNRESTKENPDKNICRNITYERNKKVMQGYTNAKWEKIEWLGWNLKYYTTDFIKIEKSIDDLRYKFINMCDDLLCIKENTFEKEIISEKWVDAFLKLYKNNSNYMVILYDIFHFQNLLQLLEKLNGKIKVYIFALSKEIYEEELYYLEKNIEIANIPDDILQTYKKIFHF